MNENKLYYWLSLSGMTDIRLNALLNVFSPLQIWDDLPESQSLKNFIGERNSAALIRFRNEMFLDEELSKLVSQNIRIVTRASDKFPKSLLQPEICPPILLYYKGDLSVLDKNCIAIVGTRACSRYGKEITSLLARRLAEEGFTIISGLATGIDEYAHRETILSGGKTAAVLGGGLNRISPVSNIQLSEDIEYNGVVLTQYAPNFSPTKYTFPERNRIISGLCMGTIVVEAGEKSGALITAEFALEQNREVFAVPGNITSSKSKGTNKLIREGARIVTCAEDVLEDLSINTTKKDISTVLMLDFFEEKIYTLLNDGDKSFDELVVLSELKPSEVNSTLMGLEIRGIVIRRGSLYGISM